ncbi:hypothetical protein PF005_g1795 [Phytophthora fragariae]|uniref:Uncharacterized protein n=1 Tax=Phytophthora fragariae TaxID=53985 RepID=A0A6A4F4J6_9STRA|nr:hypothetical protein PF003_g32330 [Phytophthora fragariae]KAE8948499.1 hypothetical protein PF009_g1921 [Phytophthora fragariae]KAE9234627.1 hypothetical protein PF005_g1795 [Phytophthora fragariae]KAE9328039.1 hypothetical protein PF001_g1589 [Phytophthora fragariae]
MVAPTPKAPRYQLTEQERRLLREALLSEHHGRRIRRSKQKESNEGVGRTKKATRKKPAKQTSPAMEVAESKRVPRRSRRQDLPALLQRLRMTAMTPRR